MSVERTGQAGRPVPCADRWLAFLPGLLSTGPLASEAAFLLGLHCSSPSLWPNVDATTIPAEAYPTSDLEHVMSHDSADYRHDTCYLISALNSARPFLCRIEFLRISAAAAV